MPEGSVFVADYGLLEPRALWLLVVVAAALWVRLRGRRAALAFGPAPLAKGLGGSWRARAARLPALLACLALTSLVFALARPARRAPLPVRALGIDVMLCVDVSSSMTERDMDPGRTRLEIAKDAAVRFLDGRPQDRVGLLRFARYPDLVCPVTLDHLALRRMVEGLETVAPDGPEDRTGIGGAVARAAQILGHVPTRSRVVVLLTDGEENVATAEAPEEVGPRRAAVLCRRLGVRVYTIAAGLGKRGPGGELRPLDVTAVRVLAERTGGAFFHARDAAALIRVYETIDRLEKAELEDPRFALQEAYAWFAGLALGLFLAARGLAATRGLEVLP